MTGLEISSRFIKDEILPLLQRELGADYDRVAVSVIGTGSDVIGMDDAISQDHHWGPRANIMCVRDEIQTVGARIDALLHSDKIPTSYFPEGSSQTFKVETNIGNMTGVCWSVVEDFVAGFLGTDRLPETSLDWLAYCEVDLFHVCRGAVIHDGPGKLTHYRDVLSSYPEEVWKKKIADWCMYITGRNAPYNYHRATKRKDYLTAGIYLSLYMKRVMELCFTLNRELAPYTKWLYRMVRDLPRYTDAVVAKIDQIGEQEPGRAIVDLMIDINYDIAFALQDLGLTTKPERRDFDDGLTDLTLYDSAEQIYRTLPPEMLAPSFNTIERWERMAREVLLDPNDYFVQVYQAQR